MTTWPISYWLLGMQWKIDCDDDRCDGEIDRSQSLFRENVSHVGWHDWELKSRGCIWWNLTMNTYLLYVTWMLSAYAWTHIGGIARAQTPHMWRSASFVLIAINAAHSRVHLCTSGRNIKKAELITKNIGKVHLLLVVVLFLHLTLVLYNSSNNWYRVVGSPKIVCNLLKSQ